MLNIAVCGLSDEDFSLLERYVERYRTDRETDVSLRSFATGEEFISNRHTFDVAVLRPDLSGTEESLALRLRQAGGKMPLIFLTDKKHFSIPGSAVIDALGFLSKPLFYPAFSTMLDRAQTRLVCMDVPTVAVLTPKGSRRISVDQITYLEGSLHHVVYHMTDGELRIKGSLSDEAKKLTADRFFRLGSYLINLGHVYKVWDADVYVGNACLPLPRNKKAAFLTGLSAFMNRG